MQFWSELTPETRRIWNKKGNVIYSSNLEKNFSKCRNDSLSILKLVYPNMIHCLFVGMTTKIIFKLVAF